MPALLLLFGPLFLLGCCYRLDLFEAQSSSLDLAEKIGPLVVRQNLTYESFQIHPNERRCYSKGQLSY